MSQLYNVSQENNPIYRQAELADAAKDRDDLRANRKAADEYHTNLQLQQTIDLDGNGDGRSKDSRLLNILASKSVIG
ncbi:hypothetical protein [Endozoicomonas sp. SCSIO W0465]|uniref:hypothetical protein n=1 Tax=Endozoicomonas sp. SCSIO W0465 TaxID=2918516 RepID=UPI00207519A6|nr:hypothetical protein [Endozoicomonas sp. SCSIO W0465]USE36660.1 hypothetical protein MJO57_32435 [Endozoicomonas sp. SCSIO W0465]